MALVAHPNVVTVHEVGEHAGRTFIAMERIDGRTLREWAALAPRTTDEILGVFVQAARGLAAAHAVGLVHRDFKPENVLVGDDGRVRVVDFGLARTREGDDPWLGDAVATRDPGSLDVRVTATGAIAGTPAYMAPEQWLQREPDHRVDQFAWAVALWESLHGARPHAGAIEAVRRERVVAGDPRHAGGAGVCRRRRPQHHRRDRTDPDHAAAEREATPDPSRRLGLAAARHRVEQRFHRGEARLRIDGEGPLEDRAQPRRHAA